MIDLDRVLARYDTKRWPAVIHMNGKLLAPNETPEDVAALVAELRAAREAREELAFAVRDLLDWAKRTHSGGIGPAPHPEEYFRTTEHAQRVLDDHAPGAVA